MADPCTSRARRATMTDAEFWADVFPQPAEPDDGEPEMDGQSPDWGVPGVSGLCPECGAAGACAWDANGRPLIHAVERDE